MIGALEDTFECVIQAMSENDIENSATIDESLEISPRQFEEWLQLVGQKLAQHLESLDDQPVWSNPPEAAEVRKLHEPIPESGESLETLVDRILGPWQQNSFHPASPGYLAYIPGGGIVQAALADLIANVINRYVGVWIAAPWLAQLESVVIRWFCDAIGYPKSAGGFLTSGGSMAEWCGILSARQRLETNDRRRARIYSTDQAHHSIAKAVRLAGFESDQIHWIATDRDYRIDTSKLCKAIDDDRKNGDYPAIIIGQAGTTNSGAVDDLCVLADIASQNEMWLHVDAAYGGFFMLTPEGREKLKGIERADSVVLDPHKGLFLPYGTGSLIVKEASTLRDVFSMTSDYMPPMQADEAFVDFCEISPELSRDNRGLRVWLPIKMHGVDVFRKNLKEKLLLAQWANDELLRLQANLEPQVPSGRLDIIAPQLSVVAFRWNWLNASDEECNEFNQELLKRVNQSRRFYLTPTVLDNRFTIRICILSFRTHQPRVQECLTAIENELQGLIREYQSEITH